MRRLLLLAVLVAVASLSLGAGSGGAITFGKPDGELHRNVGAILADYDPDSPGLDVLCTGTLIAPRVVQTAGHCTDFLAFIGVEDVWVTFDSSFDEDSTAITGHHGSYTTHPSYGFSGPGGLSNPFDLAVVVLDDAVVSRTPAQLPEIGHLDRMKSNGQLRRATFTAVGYGTVRDDKTGGPHAFFFDGIRRYALQSYNSLNKAWLNLSMQPSTGDGGTCFGDSGGPHFLGGKRSNLIVSLTVLGDAMCRATDKTYRLDTTWARDFLESFPGVDYPG